MLCPKCETSTAVLDSRPTKQKRNIRRRRLCTNQACAHIFTTYEMTGEDQEELKSGISRGLEIRRLLREFLARLDKLL